MKASVRSEMTLGEHLAELRTRLLRVIIAVVLAAVAGWFAYDPVLEVLKRPYCELPEAYRTASGECALVVTRVLEGFAVHVKVALVVGLIIAAPVLFHQLWQFITPALTDRERRYSLPFVFCSQLMFLLGAVFATFVIPKGLAFLIALGGDQVATLLSLAEYVSFVLSTVIAFGIVFEVPLVFTFLAAVGVLSSDQLRRFRPYALVLNILTAAVITPTVDAVSMMFLAAPMAVLYEGSIIAARLIERARHRRMAVAGEGSTA